MSEPADEEVPQTSSEVVEEIEAKQVVDGEDAEEIQPENEETEVLQDKEESTSDDQEVEQHPETEESESQSQSQEEQQEQQQQEEQNHVEGEEPERALDDSQDTVKLPITDSPERAIEDEEMPSMVTISSTSRVDESETYHKQDEDSKFVDVGGGSPKQTVTQDSDSDSVCVIDDDDDEEEPNDYDEDEDDRNGRRRVRHDDEDEEESSYEEDDYEGSSSYSEGMDDDEYNEKYDKRYPRNDRRDIEEDIEDDEEEEEEDGDNEDDMMDDQDFGGGGSDDAVLRPNSNGLSRQPKERCASLQDLSVLEGTSPKNRHNVNPFSQKAIFERNQGKRKPYAHVESKVKKYIDGLAEQRRISNDNRRKKSIDEERYKNEEPTDIQIQRSEEVVMSCQTMKNYTEKALKEVAECEENENMIFLQQGVENGELSLIPRQLMPSHTVEKVNKTQEMEIDLVDEDEEKRPTFNGTAPKENQNNFVTERRGLRRNDGPPKSSILNGEDPLSYQPHDNHRELSYNEYMKGPVSEVNEVVVEAYDPCEVQTISVQNAEIEDDSGLRIESVVSNYSSEKAVDDFQNRKTPPMMVHQSTETFYQENPEINNLKQQLNHRNQQFEGLREAYQKTISDNMAMRMELENLRKAVTFYQQQQKSPQVETKVSAVQTEIPANSRDMPLIDLDENDPKLGVSVSTQWSDATGSVATISMDPPNVTTALNSDESCQPPKTPMPKKGALSRAFMTSTKILQTLSSITYGKTKTKVKTPKINEMDKSSKPNPPNSKKRKASDTMDDSTQPTKIPHLSKSTDQEDDAPRTPEPQLVNLDDMEQEIGGASTGKKADERKEEEPLSDEDVKVYVYPDDEEGGEHSFLIQAKEVTENPKPGVRECGPYLLGNVEVYMTEVNGTINIWGKELSQTSQTTTEDLDASTRSKDLRQNLRWQSTPRIFNKHEGGSASTGKKSRLLPKYAPKYAQPSEYQEPHCEHNQRLSWPSCHDHHQHQHQHQHQHSCCSPPVIRVEAPCGCIHEQKRTTPSCCKTKSMPNMAQTCCCSGHKPLARRHSFNPTDEEDSEDEDANQTIQADSFSPHSCTSKSKMMHHNSAEPRRSTGSSSDPSTACESESDPLISGRQVLEGFEGPEKKRKKKVRGLLMDLLRKGCGGDCRTPLDKSNLHHSIYEPSTSAQHKSPKSYNQPSNEKCSSCCKPDKTQVLEAQMERFKEEMDKLRSQSDTLAGMIQALKNADIIN